jgi:hypothetical protein
MNKVIETVTSPTARMWCYNLMIAVMAYLTVKGYLKGDETAALTAIGAAFFAVASVNTPKSNYQGKHEAE